jgi:uncharacterized cupredoxin-like copper-binding protein
MNRELCLGRRTLVACVALSFVFVLSGCPQNGGGDGGGGGGGGTTVNVTLREFSVTPATSSAPAGTVTFHVSNAGTVTHEFLVIRTDLAPDDLPTESNGSYEEDGPGTDLLDEIEAINPGRTQDLTLDLDAGNYVLICNMVNQGFVHYALGMHTAFTVTAGQ